MKKGMSSPWTGSCLTLLMVSYQASFFVTLSFRPYFSWSCHKNASTVVDGFEYHQKRLRNNSCKSFNVRPGADIAKRLCELNNKTRKMTPESFKKMKGSSYYGPVKVSSTDWIISTMAFHLTNKEALTVPCSVVKEAVRGRREHEKSVEGNRRRSRVFLPTSRVF